MHTDYECSICGKAAQTKKGNYQYRESGLDNIELKNIQIVQCPSCGNEDPVIPRLEELHSIIAMALISKPARIAGKELRFLRKHLEWSGRELARMIHVDHTTVSKWENGEQAIGPQSDLLIRALVLSKEQGKLGPLQEKMEALDEKSIANGPICINPEAHDYAFA